MQLPTKATNVDFLGRFREVVSDPLNLLIERVPLAGTVHNNEVFLHNGNKVPVAGPEAYYGTFSQLLIVNRGVIEPLEEYVFQEVLKNLPIAPLMIELGAYWAHYSMWLKKVKAKAKAIMVEADLSNLAAGKNNFKRNEFNGEFIHASVSKNNWELDAFLQSRNIARLDILHADIQGFEVELVEKGRDTLSKHLVNYLFISTHSQEIHERILDELGKYGYRVEVKSDFEHHTTSGDGFVFASNPQIKPIFRNFAPLGRRKIARSSTEDLVQAILNARDSTA